MTRNETFPSANTFTCVRGFSGDCGPASVIPLMPADDLNAVRNSMLQKKRTANELTKAVALRAEDARSTNPGFDLERGYYNRNITELLGPVNACMVVATEAIFSQDKATRVPCSQSTQMSANAGLRENGPVPSGCA